MISSKVTIRGSFKSTEYRKILSTEACNFLIFLHVSFEKQRKELLDQRRLIQTRINMGWRPSFPSETEDIRNDKTWRGAIPAPGLVDRRVEITGPAHQPKMVINALNSGATQFMADFEDSNSPTWENCIDSQINLKNAVSKSILFISPEGKKYQLNDSTATLIVRPRGLHMTEKHFCINNQPISASFFDFGLFFFHNAKTLLAQGLGPYFYLPKIENRFEARLWNLIFNGAQDFMSIPRGSIRATVLIETILAAFQMEEIIFELKDHCSGLNCGRWDYIFSLVKKFGSFYEFLLPDRSQVTMQVPFMTAYVNHLIHVCHKRQVHAMGGMSAFIPIKANSELNENAMKMVSHDKLREVLAGHDGTWVAHPGLVSVAKDTFDAYMPGPNQLFYLNTRPSEAEQLLDTYIPGSKITMDGVLSNISIALLYIDSWLSGVGCIPVNNLMEDAATAEIARVQLWQWLHHRVSIKESLLQDSSSLLCTPELIHSLVNKVWSNLKMNTPTGTLAKEKLLELILAKDCPDFLTTHIYDDGKSDIFVDKEKRSCL